ncbi:hypothetical protein KKC08_00680 [Patescibacteria group bacterium]|nr:hypothetical protein [Patescibacteria group bacterium]MCG2701833.1 hypothetical protein [Candidatus Parcubacteria bacterium]MBU4265240.1 hypothetical protein [Patescibacteria group bacterium]MBU4390283.1 hypothetical protein [Patescibacteria group bacterium]MBU4396670.1 hypothetical protein [Patescibacteria group bacterium]
MKKWENKKWEEMTKIEKAIGLFIVFSIISIIVSKVLPSKTVNVAELDTTEVSPSPTEVEKSDEQVLEEKLINIVKTDGSNMNFRKLDAEEPSLDNPEDSQLTRVSIDVKSFLNKDHLLRSTGKLSSSIFQAIYGAENIETYNTTIWYYGETTDRYGNTNNNAVLIYTVNKDTYEKINWDNFNQYDLCDFLKNEEILTGKNNTRCDTLVNIE